MRAASAYAGTAPSFLSYGYNAWGAAENLSLNNGLGAYTDVKPTKPVNVVKPTDCIALADSNWDLKKKGDSDWSGFIGMYAERQWPLDLHGARVNILFADNHAQAPKRKAVVGQLNTDVAAQQEANRIWNIDNKIH